jgi:hypothetical protein
MRTGFVTTFLLRPGVTQNVSGVWPAAGEEGASAGTAQRILAVSAIKLHPAHGEIVDVRRFDQRMAVTTEVIVQVIGDDEKHV